MRPLLLLLAMLACCVPRRVSGLVLRGKAVSFYVEIAADAGVVGLSGVASDDLEAGGGLLFLSDQVPAGAPYSGSVELLHRPTPDACPRVVAIRRLSACAVNGGEREALSEPGSAVIAFSGCASDLTTASVAYASLEAFPNGAYGLRLRNATVEYAGVHALRVWLNDAPEPDEFVLTIEITDGRDRARSDESYPSCPHQLPTRAEAPYSGDSIAFEPAAHTHPLSTAQIVQIAVSASIAGLVLVGCCLSWRRRRCRSARISSPAIYRRKTNPTAVVNEDALVRLGRELSASRGGRRLSASRGHVAAVPALSSIAEEPQPRPDVDDHRLELPPPIRASP
ncbi:envelope glycoprotein I [Saimiriine alphaherpesvirus 1]|uniref:Envelope glycoprotein I n=1 Tax=Saimiriine herpesvirus 1 (strain MV-5-4-PSL) TaxID=10353 RepID=E2IUH9_SHV1|nr:envelope glycoprotein I [Saimiriine alphaherpesvirus 1]ADO13837.1 envelope glycoprotein I [Saimiriine alphaherpesvirus 1]